MKSLERRLVRIFNTYLDRRTKMEKGDKVKVKKEGTNRGGMKPICRRQSGKGRCLFREDKTPNRKHQTRHEASKI